MRIANRHNRMMRLVAGALLVTIAALALNACLPGQEPATPTPTAGDLVTAFIGDLAASATAGGRVVAAREVSLAVQVPGRVEEVYVSVGDRVETGDTLVQLETDDLALNVAAAELNVRLQEANLAALQEAPAEAEIASAKAAVTSAEANLADLRAGLSPAEITAAEVGLRSAQASLRSAQIELDRAQSSITKAQRQTAEAALMAAQLQQRNAVEANKADPTEATHRARLAADQAVAEAQAQLDALQPDEATLANAQEGVTAAAANVAAAQADLNRQLSGATAAQIAAAESQLAQATASLADLTAGPTEAQIAAAEAELVQAQLSLTDAQELLARATVVAPFPGLVAAVHVSPGEYANGVVVELIGASDLEVVLEVDEIDVGELSRGQSATVTLEAWPEVEIPAEVRSIAPGATTNPGSSLVTYEVHLGLGASDLPVRAGMTANASLITARREGVLLVPNAAIQVDRQAGRYSVNLVVDGSVQEVPVTVGLHDDEHTQITGGLQEGDQVWIGEIDTGLLDSDGGGFFGQDP